MTLRQYKSEIMNKLVKIATSDFRRDEQDGHNHVYLESLALVERLHRALLDVIKDEFDRREIGRAHV